MVTKSLKILMVDDNPAVLKLQQRILEREGFTIFTADNGESAIKIVAAQNVDIALVDVRLQDMSGFDVCTRIRYFSQIPILFLTGSASQKDIELARTIGANGLILKPFLAKGLIQKIEAVIERKQFLTPDLS